MLRLYTKQTRILFAQYVVGLFQSESLLKRSVSSRHHAVSKTIKTGILTTLMYIAKFSGQTLSLKIYGNVKEILYVKLRIEEPQSKTDSKRKYQ